MWSLIADLFILIRNARAWLVAITLFGALLWTLWETSAKRIEYQELSGEMLEITVSGKKEDPMFYHGKVRLQDGKMVDVTMSPRPPLPKIGDHVPIIFERYEDGKVIYGFNNAQWISDGGVSN